VFFLLILTGGNRIHFVVCCFLQAKFEERKKSYEENLAVRRRRLADLYNDEMDAWKVEVLGKVETQEDRKARIMQKAYALRDAREKDRQDLVKQKLDDQWRDSCDDARTLDSKALVQFMNEQRVFQIKEKVEKKQALSAQEDAFLEVWNRQLDAVARKETEKQENRRRIDRETSEAIRKQVC
jgi:cilia- and flagella-associated protein 53